MDFDVILTPSGQDYSFDLQWKSPWLLTNNTPKNKDMPFPLFNDCSLLFRNKRQYLPTLDKIQVKLSIL